jgi:dipeptidyl aminopeptidase/acylaminoacyl peptidase
VPYETPGPDVVAVIDAPPTPLALRAPGGEFVVLVDYQAHPPVSQLARPFLALAGIRIDPALGGRQRVRQPTGLSVLRLADGAQRPVAVPDGAGLSVPVWAPDGRRFVFTVDQGDRIGVWVADAQTATASPVPGLVVRDVLGGDPFTPGAAAWWSRDGRSLLALGAPAGPAPAAAAPPEPQTEEAAGKHPQLATYQDLLASAADEDLFEALATTIPVRVDPGTGHQQELGPPGLYRHLAESPDGAHLLVHLLRRPFSFRVPYHYFARRTEVWSAAGGVERVIADQAVSDEVPRQGVPSGPRQISWEERAPASLLWVAALDGGDPVQPAEYRDRIWRLATLQGEPEQAFDLRHRCVYWADLDQPHRLLLAEHDRDRRWLTTWDCDLSAPQRNRVLFDHSADDAYADPGTALVTTKPDGRRTVLQDGGSVYLRGKGATPDGDRPFLDRLDLDSGRSTRLFRSPADCLEEPFGFAADDRAEILFWHQSPAQPPNLFAVAADGSARRQLTSWPDPHPQLTGLTRQLVTHDRGDGVLLSGMLYLPPGYDPAADGRLPLVLWAYPLDYGDAATAGQVHGSSKRFTRLSALEPTWFVLRGYAVLANATMPVIGDPETMNDSFVEQISLAARAHIKALDDMGIIDPARVATGGHSYGAFMTANLLAHTDLFAAGIARSGAYNRTLTPFGFQSERRSFWEAPAVYDQMSPFRHADQITAPILFIHGLQDNNSGTYPMQSQRMFQAVQGTGGTARLVLLPHESHGYAARESVLHVLAEQYGWLDRWLAVPPGQPGEPGSPVTAANQC